MNINDLPIRLWQERFFGAASQKASGKSPDIHALVKEAKEHVILVAKANGYDEKEAIKLLGGGLKIHIDVSKQPPGYNETIQIIINEINKS